MHVECLVKKETGNRLAPNYVICVALEDFSRNLQDGANGAL